MATRSASSTAAAAYAGASYTQEFKSKLGIDREWWAAAAKLANAAESLVLLSMVTLQLFADWNGWEYSNDAELLALHLVGVSLAVWHGLQPLQVVVVDAQRTALRFFRWILLVLDVLVLWRTGRLLYHERNTSNSIKVLLIALLTLGSSLRLLTFHTKSKDTPDAQPLQFYNRANPRSDFL